MSLSRSITAVWHNPWNAEEVKQKFSLSQFRSLYKKALWLRANPRNEEYMRALVSERFPDAEFRSYENGMNIENRDGTGEVILLYPDSIGQGFKEIEDRMLRDFPGKVRVLNGRRRLFPLTPRTLKRLRFKRFVERTMLGELCFLIAFVILSSFFVAVDFLKGRR